MHISGFTLLKLVISAAIRRLINLIKRHRDEGARQEVLEYLSKNGESSRAIYIDDYKKEEKKFFPDPETLCELADKIMKSYQEEKKLEQVNDWRAKVLRHIIAVYDIERSKIPQEYWHNEHKLCKLANEIAKLYQDGNDSERASLWRIEAKKHNKNIISYARANLVRFPEVDSDPMMLEPVNIFAPFIRKAAEDDLLFAEAELTLFHGNDAE